MKLISSICCHSQHRFNCNTVFTVTQVALLIRHIQLAKCLREFKFADYLSGSCFQLKERNHTDLHRSTDQNRTKSKQFIRLKVRPTGNLHILLLFFVLNHFIFSFIIFIVNFILTATCYHLMFFLALLKENMFTAYA